MTIWIDKEAVDSVISDAILHTHAHTLPFVSPVQSELDLQPRNIKSVSCCFLKEKSSARDVLDTWSQGSWQTTHKLLSLTITKNLLILYYFAEYKLPLKGVNWTKSATSQMHSCHLNSLFKNKLHSNFSSFSLELSVFLSPWSSPAANYGRVHL